MEERKEGERKAYNDADSTRILRPSLSWKHQTPPPRRDDTTAKSPLYFSVLTVISPNIRVHTQCRWCIDALWRGRHRSRPISASSISIPQDAEKSAKKWVLGGLIWIRPATPRSGVARPCAPLPWSFSSTMTLPPFLFYFFRNERTTERGCVCSVVPHLEASR